MKKASQAKVSTVRKQRKQTDIYTYRPFKKLALYFFKGQSMEQKT